MINRLIITAYMYTLSAFYAILPVLLAAIPVLLITMTLNSIFQPSSEPVASFPTSIGNTETKGSTDFFETIRNERAINKASRELNRSVFKKRVWLNTQGKRKLNRAIILDAEKFFDLHIENEQLVNSCVTKECRTLVVEKYKKELNELKNTRTVYNHLSNENFEEYAAPVATHIEEMRLVYHTDTMPSEEEMQAMKEAAEAKQEAERRQSVLFPNLVVN